LYGVGNGQAVPLQSADRLRVVRQDPDRAEAEVGEDLVADPPVSRIRRKAEFQVRLDGVETVLLQLVGLQLVEQADSSPLLGHVEQDATILAGELNQSLLELLAAVTAQRVEDVAGQAFGVDADEDLTHAVD